MAIVLLRDPEGQVIHCRTQITTLDLIIHCFVYYASVALYTFVVKQCYAIFSPNILIHLLRSTYTADPLF